MKVVSDGIFDVYVYPSEAMQRHHLPHCHVRSKDGDIVVSLPTIGVIVGSKLPKRAKDLVIENIDEIFLAWNKLNPEIKADHE